MFLLLILPHLLTWNACLPFPANTRFVNKPTCGHIREVQAGTLHLPGPASGFLQKATLLGRDLLPHFHCGFSSQLQFRCVVFFFNRYQSPIFVSGKILISLLSPPSPLSL